MRSFHRVTISAGTRLGLTGLGRREQADPLLPPHALAEGDRAQGTDARGLGVDVRRKGMSPRLGRMVLTAMVLADLVDHAPGAHDHRAEVFLTLTRRAKAQAPGHRQVERGCRMGDAADHLAGDGLPLPRIAETVRIGLVAQRAELGVRQHQGPSPLPQGLANDSTASPGRRRLAASCGCRGRPQGNAPGRPPARPSRPRSRWGSRRGSQHS